MKCKNCKHACVLPSEPQQHIGDIVELKYTTNKHSSVWKFFTILWILTSPLIIGAAIPIALAVMEYSGGIAFLAYLVYTIIWLAFHALLLDKDLLAL
jgi:hypothetical protein